MPDCKKLEPFVTPYVDGQLDRENRAEVDAHLRVCPPCHARIVIEQSVRALLTARQQTLKREAAPASLQERCGEIARVRAGATASPGAIATASATRAPWRARLQPFALAASLVFLVGAAFYGVTDRSNGVMAAELVVDHIKCFGVNRLVDVRQPPSIVEAAMASGFGWHMRLPAEPQQIGLELVGARPCLYGGGRVAHIMYRHNGNPVSVFMLPRSVRPSEVLDVMGHEAAIWPSGDRTFVLVAREPREEVERLASFVHASLR
jgi:anti-sigma factor RsiW